ncbi:Alpha/Beta hydrolase protein [Corynascus novoguineensis]|uniref:Alpha/Beta hydrolase protein n=1 Tax=Corynascus novoguineensis TaxID=1126955 RepID=A0AAN7HFF6_9PEZI|nr:Alpha/Beta hydrolase protein [Corynascus novoguineensis]
MPNLRATVDGIPVVNLASPEQQAGALGSVNARTRRLHTARDAIGQAPSRFWLRASAAWWRALQYVGMTLHFLAPERPPNPCFSRTIRSTISETKGEFTLQFYTPEGYKAAVKTGAKFPAVVNFHGGGFTIGNATDDARFARFVLQECNAVFVSVDYRLSPEHPFPVAVEDAADALLYLIRSGPDLHIDPSKLATSGFSAGANLAITCTLRLADHLETLRRSGEQIPDHHIRAVATWYPITDYTEPRAAKRAASIRPDQTIPETLTSLFDASYLHPPELQLATSYLSPSQATDEQLTNAIPDMVIFFTCEHDMLMQEGEALARRLREPPIGKDVRYKMIEGVPHAWDKSPDPTKPAEFSEDLYRECCGHLREAFEKP